MELCCGKALNPCISAIDDEMRASQNADARNTSSPKHRLLNRIIGIAASSLAGGGGSGGGSGQNGLANFGFGNKVGGKGDLSELIVRQVQEKVMDFVKDQVINPNSGLVSGFAANNMLMKLNQYLKPADGGGHKQIFNFGEKGSGFRQKSTSAIQDYDELHKKCLHLGELFEDPSFPASTESLFYTPQRNAKFEWKRPHELIENPRFFVEDASRFDVKQGELGDCWLLAAVANLTLHKQLFNRVVPPNQSFRDQYAGIFHFRFWQYGKWIDVVIDDRLPTVNGHLMFMHSASRNEFWSALLEKAYAKLHGSYEALKGGSFGEAVEDFTGGIAEFYDLHSKECPEDLYSLMQKGYERGSFMGCSINALSPDQTNQKMSNGLVMGHAYSITGMSEVQLTTSRVRGKIPLVRIRNPWGNETEWNGAWSDGSREWSIISESEKNKLQLEFKDDGEHWMSFQDFKTNFTNLEICNLSPEPLNDEDEHQHANGDAKHNLHFNKHWEEITFEGSWISGVSAGGCRNYLQTYALNPQYLIKLVDHDEDDDHNLCTLIIALMQKNHRVKRKMGVDTLTIGFAVYEIKDHLVTATDEPLAKAGFVRKQLLNTEFFKYNASVARSPNFINLREVTLRVKLPPGRYCIIPSTYEPGYEGDFLLRIFTEKKPSECCENDNEVGIITDPNEDNKENEIDDDPLPNGYHHHNDYLHDKNEPNQPEPDPDTIERIVEFLGTCCTLLIACISTMNTVTNENAEKVHFDSLDASSKNKNAEYRTAPASVQAFFAKISGEDSEVDAEELMQILNYALKKEFKYNDGFSIESCRSMVAMLDDDRSGKLGIDEFTLLWRYVKHWTEVFKKHDVNGDQLMNSSELRNALLDAKMSANRVVLQTLILRYGHITGGKKGDLKVERSLTFDNFILCCIKLKHCIDLWSAQMSEQQSVTDSKNDNEIKNPTFTLDKFIETVMYS